MPTSYVFPLLFAIFCANSLRAQDIPLVHRGSGWTLPGNSVKWVRNSDRIEGSGSALSLILACGKDQGWIEYACNGKPCVVHPCKPCPDAACEGVRSMRVDPPQGGLFATLVHALDSLFIRQEQAPVLLAARAGGSPNDSPLLLKGNEVLWGPALRRVLEGKYCFRLTSLTGTKTAASGNVRTFELDWDRAKDASGAARLEGIAPGAYLLEKGTAEGCAADGDSAAAWVTLVPEARFPSLEAEWVKTGEWLGKLSDQGASLQTLTAVRRALLSAMADAIEKP